MEDRERCRRDGGWMPTPKVFLFWVVDGRSSARTRAARPGVLFSASSATWPWTVATEVPEEIYTIAPSSPVYYATFADVYSSTDV